MKNKNITKIVNKLTVPQITTLLLLTGRWQKEDDLVGITLGTLEALSCNRSITMKDWFIAWMFSYLGNQNLRVKGRCYWKLLPLGKTLQSRLISDGWYLADAD